MKNKISLKFVPLFVLTATVLTSLNLVSQVITFERTDVEGKKADFVTATYSFGIDIKIEDIENCSNVAFELSHNLAQFVRFSEYKNAENWGQGVTIVVDVPVDNQPDRAILAIQAGTGFPADANSPNNPKIIHLEFVVAPSAIHNQILEFSISKVRATLFKDSVVELIIPTVFRIPYRIHSYVDVWPGDADCNGEVDAYDFDIVSLYLTEPTDKSRGFKRESASILWQPQICIAWDTLAATYADCDGNGIVTTSDFAVIALNYGRKHNSNCNTAFSSIGFIDEVTETKTNSMQNNFEITENTITIPINIDLSENTVIGAAGIIDYSLEPNVKIIGMSAGEFFDNSSLHYFINPKTNKASFCIRNSDNQTQSEPKNNIIAYLHIEDNSATNTTKDKTVSDFIGFDALGNIKKLNQSYTSIPLISSDIIFTVNYDAGKILVKNQNIEIENIKILNILGNTVADFSFARHNIYDIGSLPTGVYFVIATNQKETFRTKFFKP